MLALIVRGGRVTSSVTWDDNGLQVVSGVVARSRHGSARAGHGMTLRGLYHAGLVVAWHTGGGVWLWGL